MQISDEPAEIRDIAATVCKETGDCRSLGGAPLDELPKSRRRSYFHYVWRNEFWSSDRIESMNEYEIDGPVWRPASWSRVQPPRLPPDETVLINNSFPSRARYLDWGWSLLEKGGVWSDGPSAALSFSRTGATRRPLDLVLDVILFVRPESPSLSVSLTANGRPVESWRFEYPRTEATLRARLEPEMWGAGNQMTIQLYFERDVPLENLPDPPGRMLGVGLRSMRLESATTTND